MTAPDQPAAREGLERAMAIINVVRNGLSGRLSAESDEDFVARVVAPIVILADREAALAKHIAGQDARIAELEAQLAERKVVDGLVRAFLRYEQQGAQAEPQLIEAAVSFVRHSLTPTKGEPSHDA
jgi:hypothetical protein